MQTFVESPYSGEIEKNVEYALQCMQHELKQGNAPFLSHLLYTQAPKKGFVADDDKENQCVGRDAAIRAAGMWRRSPGVVTRFYTDLGWSGGMKAALEECKTEQLPYEFCSLKIKT